jgi:SAM-dependent methyltransferase
MYTKCDADSWNNAQNAEFSLWGGFNVGDGDDWSEFWKINFDNYDAINGKFFKDVIEVGCGPYGRNIRKISTLITYENLHVLDPLLDKYCKNKKSGIHNFITTNNVKTYSFGLEKLSVENSFDLIICNNVLDHCYDADLCLENMYNALRPNGILIFGNDTKDINDAAIARDTMHPLMIEIDYIKNYSSKYKILFEKFIDRKNCRNPVACCGCVFYILQKVL